MKPSAKPYDIVKRTADIVSSAMLLVLLSPVLLVTALLVRMRLGSPVLFVQQRPGRGGDLFGMHKFRTMREASPTLSAEAAVESDATRLTPFGAKLRASSLDELPELWDVLRGKMSIVGPRPLLPEYLTRYNERQARRHEVRPGITGWAQVNGRNAVEWDDRLEMDVYYVENRSLAFDLRILAMTLRTVSTQEGVRAEGHASMRPFDPNGATEAGTTTDTTDTEERT